MNKLFFILFSFFIVSCEVHSNSLETKDDFYTIQKKIDNIKTKYKIEISLEKPKKCTWNEVYYDLLEEKDYPQLLKYLDFIEDEFGKYPNCLWLASGNPRLVLVKDLFYQKQSRGGIPDCYLEFLYFDIHLGSYNESYQRHVLHHEFYHMLEEEKNSSPYYKDPAWNKLNTEGFQYGSGGANDRDGNHSVLNHPQEGFITRYAMSGLEEDKAETYASLWVESDRKKVKPFREADQTLESKYQFLYQALQKYCPEMNEKFWKKIEN